MKFPSQFRGANVKMNKMIIGMSVLFIVITTAGCAGESSGIDKESISIEISADADFESNELFVDYAEVLNDHSENEFAVTSEEAMSDLIDALVICEKWREDFKLICSGMMTLNKEAYYQITLSTENDFSYSNVGAFWVSANSGMIYLRFDPTLDAGGYFSEFADNISGNDNRTRLIAFPLETK